MTIQQPPEIIYTENKKTVCNGGGGALGHPAVYYTIGEEGYADCRYCGRRFVYQPDPHAH